MLVLASSSPRRRLLLGEIVESFDVQPADVNEVAPRRLPINEALEVIAKKKAAAVSRERPDDWVIGADTIVSFNGELVGKAHSEEEARLTLASLAGEQHAVYTGIALAYGGRPVDEGHAVTKLRMNRFSRQQLDEYLDSGNWKGKAGAYGIQDELMSPHLELLEGSLSNVVGLPLVETCRMLRANKVQCFDPPSEERIRKVVLNS